MFNGILKIQFFIDISWRCLNLILIGLINSNNLVIFKFGNSRFGVNDHFNNKKLESSQI